MRLPDELFCMIWIHLTCEEEEDFRTHISVSQVCSRWRRIAVNLPALWTRPTLRVSGKNHSILGRSSLHNLHMFKEHIRRSKNDMLTVFLTLSWMRDVSPAVIAEMRNELLLNASRIVKMDVEATTDDCNVLLLITDRFDALNHLTLRSSYWLDEPVAVNGFNLLKARPPRLQQLFISDNTFWDWETQPPAGVFPALRELECDISDSAALESIVAACPNLERLHVNGCMAPIDFNGYINEGEAKDASFHFHISGICCHQLGQYFECVHCPEWRSVEIEWEALLRPEDYPDGNRYWWRSAKDMPLSALADFFSEVQPTRLSYRAERKPAASQTKLTIEDADGRMRKSSTTHEHLRQLGHFLLKVDKLQPSWFACLEEMTLYWGQRRGLVKDGLLFPALRTLTLFASSLKMTRSVPRPEHCTAPKLARVRLGRNDDIEDNSPISAASVVEFARVVSRAEDRVSFHIDTSVLEAGATVQEIKDALKDCCVDFS